MSREKTKVSGFLQSSANWLEVHHAAKLDRRRALVANIGLRPGDKVLEIASGPGHFTEMFAEAVGKTGEVVAFDIDQNLLEAAKLKAIPNAEFIAADFCDLSWIRSLADKNFDIAIMFNCLVYYQDYTTIIGDLAGILRPTSRLVIKDSDFEHILTNICDMRSFLEIIYANKYNDKLKLDNFLGSKLFGKKKFDGATVTGCYTWPYLMQSPFTESQVRYICENIEILLKNAEGNVSQAAIDDVTSGFDEKRLRQASSSESLFFLMHDFIVEIAGSNY